MKKDKAIQVINEMPQDIDLEQLIDRLLFIDKVEKGLEQLDQGKTVSHEDVKARVREW